MYKIPRQSYTAEYKQEAVRQAEVEGKSPAQAARDLGIAEQTLSNWRKASKAGKLAAGSNGVQGMESQSQPRQLGRPAGLHGGARRLPAWPVDSADAPQSRMGRVVDGMAHRTHQLKAIGNGQVPRVAATAWRMLDVWGG